MEGSSRLVSRGGPGQCAGQVVEMSALCEVEKRPGLVFSEEKGAGIWGWAGGQTRDGVSCSHQLPSTVMDILPGHRPRGSAETARFSEEALRSGPW